MNGATSAHLDGGEVVARFRERDGDAAGAGAPLDHGAALAFGEGEPEGKVVVVDILGVVEVCQRIILGGQARSLDDLPLLSYGCISVQ